jgi:hypothetical protein
VLPSAAETVTIDGVVYTFRAAPAAAYDVLRGGDGPASRDNLIAAINLSGTAGVTYGAGTAVHPSVIADLSGAQMRITAKVPGSHGNLIPVAENMAGAGNVWTNQNFMENGYGDTGDILGVVWHDYSSGGAVTVVPRTQYAIGQVEDGWDGDVEKLSFQRTIGTYVTGDAAYVAIQASSLKSGW